jgi:hypothetical protein
MTTTTRQLQLLLPSTLTDGVASPQPSPPPTTHKTPSRRDAKSRYSPYGPSALSELGDPGLIILAALLLGTERGNPATIARLAGRVEGACYSRSHPTSPMEGPDNLRQLGQREHPSCRTRPARHPELHWLMCYARPRDQVRDPFPPPLG